MTLGSEGTEYRTSGSFWSKDPVLKGEINVARGSVPIPTVRQRG